MAAADDIRAVLKEWMDGLDAGELERLVATCDPDVIICNQRRPTSLGLQAIRDKYGPIIESQHVKSGFDIQHLKVFGDCAVLVGHFTNELTDKISGQKASGEGRLMIVYRRHPDGSWKMILDTDNAAGR